LRPWILVALTAIPTFSAAVAQADPDVIWRGDFDTGTASLTGNCAAGSDQWCNRQTIRSAQIQAVPDPIAQGTRAARFEVRFGDVYNGYSDSRSLLTGPPALWEDEGNERWYRWQALWPQDWVGSYPKWDQLRDPSARSNGGSIVEWHHDANGGVESGSAPLYILADDSRIFLCLVNQATSTCRETIDLATLQRAHWHDFIVHAKWSSNASIGFLEIWIDGVNVLPKHFAANKYPGMRNYLVVGLYRNGHIGDPNLLWPDGSHVYGSDGAPGVVYLDGFIIGKTMQSVLNERPWGAQPPSGGQPDAGEGGVVASDAGVPIVTAPDLPAPDAGTVPTTKPGLAAIGYPSGCGSERSDLGGFGVGLLIAFVAVRRSRRTAADKPGQEM